MSLKNPLPVNALGSVYYAYTEREQQFVNHTAPGPGAYCQF